MAKKHHLSVYKLFLFFFFFSVLTKAQSWGTRVFEQVETKYQIYKTNYAYTDTMFLVTDIRADSIAKTINSFNIQNLSVLRAYDGTDYLTDEPVIFFVHGGGWTDGYASQYDFVSIPFTGEKGWTVVNVDYRLTSDSVFVADENCPDRFNCSGPNRKKAAWYPDNINDIGYAFEWTLENIEKYGGDTSKIFLFGHSAGAHLVALFAVHPKFRNLNRHVKGVVCLSGGYEIKTLSKLIFEEAIELTFRGGYENNDAELDEASPISYVYPENIIPPFYLLHCQFDLPSLPQQKILYHDKLTSYNFDTAQDFILNYNHISEIVAFQSPDSLPTQLVVNYIEKKIKTLGTEQATGLSPSKFELKQNFPNPVSSSKNPVTTIKYSIASFVENKANNGKVNYSQNESFVSLKVFDLFGRKVATLVNGYQNSGSYIVKFDTREFSNGVYFYRLTMGKSSIVRKMIILK